MVLMIFRNTHSDFHMKNTQKIALTIVDKYRCGWACLTRLKQNWKSQMLPFINDYVHTKTLQYYLIPSRDTDDKQILQSNESNTTYDFGNRIFSDIYLCKKLQCNNSFDLHQLLQNLMMQFYQKVTKPNFAWFFTIVGHFYLKKCFHKKLAPVMHNLKQVIKT